MEENGIVYSDGRFKVSCDEGQFDFDAGELIDFLMKRDPESGIKWHTETVMQAIEIGYVTFY